MSTTLDRIIEVDMGTSDNPCRVGAVGTPGVHMVRIVHISDTHYNHPEQLHRVPHGDILIHSGDFFNIDMPQELERDAQELDSFFASLPHKHKVFVAGNHDKCFEGQSVAALKALLPHVIYLQDEQVELEGLKIYGSPWNGDRGSMASAFVTPWKEMKKHWDLVPSDIDILVTHNPPYLINDQEGSMGCRQLKEAVCKRIRPLAHLYGHAHVPGIEEHNNILFSNAACTFSYGKPNVIDIYMAASYGKCIKQQEHGEKGCQKHHGTLS